MATIQDVRLPDLGDLDKVEIIEILVTPGDQIAVDAPLITLESDKATLEVPSPYTGIITDVLVKIGDKVQTDHLLLHMAIETAQAEEQNKDQVQNKVAPTPGKSQPELQSTIQTDPETKTIAKPESTRLHGEKASTRPPVVGRLNEYVTSKPHAGPAVRRFARELGVDLIQVTGSGPKGRILRDDVQKFVHKVVSQNQTTQPTADTNFQVPPPIQVDFKRFGPIDLKPLPRLKQLSGAHLLRSWLTIPHVTQFDTADITDLEAFRHTHNQDIANDKERKLTLLPFALKACAAALKALPIFNSAIDSTGKQLITRNYIHIGIAVDTDNGLVVPVIRNVDQLSIRQLAQILRQVSAKARSGKLTPEDMQGGCFTISNLGGIGGEYFTPIINAPEAAILGLSRAQTRPHWNGQEFQPRLMLPLSLSYDHRIIDGVDGAKFIILLKQFLQDIRHLLL
ncbi:branched-chain alpha-keto acid dehydrogenase subunit E2 [Achromatium sp. WMS3]|nr:branched-chain alpha-keto acid dehydrogenase subunit E2 [Achromatium sp. WMS3]